MTSENFTYWLQGFFEISKTNELTAEQVKEIKDHLKLVFYEFDDEEHLIYSDGSC